MNAPLTLSETTVVVAALSAVSAGWLFVRLEPRLSPRLATLCVAAVMVVSRMILLALHQATANGAFVVLTLLACLMLYESMCVARDEQERRACRDLLSRPIQAVPWQGDERRTGRDRRGSGRMMS